MEDFDMPPKIGFLFPGQGAQFTGMGKDLYGAFPAAKNVFGKADSLLGYSISQICFEGPEEKLTRTLYAQPAIFTMSLAALAILKEKFPELTPSFSAGLSLGEFTALVASGAMGFEDGLKLVAVRAEAMEQAAEKNPGTMASILGLGEADCQAVAQEAGCQVANLNSPEQIVLSGTFESIDKACQIAEAKGAKRAIKLKVGGAFHSALMAEAEARLRPALAGTTIQTPKGAFYPNVLGKKLEDSGQIRDLLAKQLTHSVRWTDTMAEAASSGIGLFFEIGPGKVLKGLVKKSQPALRIECAGSAADFEKIEQVLKQGETA